MNNALIVDLVIAAVLLIGLLIGAKRGFFKSLMGLAAVILALFGASLLADMFAPAVTEKAYVKVEAAIGDYVSGELGGKLDGAALKDIDAETLRDLLAQADPDTLPAGVDPAALEGMDAEALRGVVGSMDDAAAQQLLAEAMSGAGDVPLGDVLGTLELPDELMDALSRFGIREEAVRGALSGVQGTLGGLGEKLKAGAAPAELLRGAFGDGIRGLLGKVVHAGIFLAAFLVLLLVLKLLVALLDHIFDLPVLHSCNTLLGGVLGLAEAGVLVLLLVRAALALRVPYVADHMGDTYLLPLFAKGGLSEYISSLMQ